MFSKMQTPAPPTRNTAICATRMHWGVAWLKHSFWQRRPPVDEPATATQGQLEERDKKRPNLCRALPADSRPVSGWCGVTASTNRNTQGAVPSALLAVKISCRCGKLMHLTLFRGIVDILPSVLCSRFSENSLIVFSQSFFLSCL